MAMTDAFVTMQRDAVGSVFGFGGRMTGQLGPPRPRLRLWVPAIILFAGGFGSRLMLDATPGDPFARFGAAFGIQVLAYGAGLALLAWCWLRSSDVGTRGILGCLGWLILAAAASIAIITSGYH